MPNNTIKKPAAFTKRAGYSQQWPDLACAWLNYCENPDCRWARDHLAVWLDQVFRSRLPNGHYDGILAGREADIRQEASLLALGNYLAGNPQLMAATAAKCHREIDNQIRKTVNASFRTAFLDLLRSLTRHHAHHEYGPDMDTLQEATCDHPAQRVSLWELPLELQRAIVFSALKSAVAKELIPARSADVVVEMLENGLSQSAMAKKLGVTRQTISERVAPVRKLIATLVEAQEFPLL